jgi:plasmid stabilization system protein ParE
VIYKIRILKPAQLEIREIYRYIAEELNSPMAAAHHVALIDKAIVSLQEAPTRFPLVRDGYLALKGHRMIVVKNHLVFFIVREEESVVSVMRVLYGRRDWLHLLKADTEEIP